MDQKTCKTCGSSLQKRLTQKKASRLTKEYYYTAYWYCPSCKKMYLDDAFKVENNHASLFNSNLLEPEKVDVNIWTDGACSNNGNSHAKAAWAFVSGSHEASGLVEGKQTNNVAEALAIYNALKWAVEKGYKTIRILSDSQISINNLKKPVSQIKENKHVFEDIYGLIAAHNLTVSYEKVLGHSGDINNERADKLANGLVGIK